MTVSSLLVVGNSLRLARFPDGPDCGPPAAESTGAS
jgi:hypothetical protein